MPKKSKFSITMTIEVLFIVENIWYYGAKNSQRERQRERERERERERMRMREREKDREGERAINIQSKVFKPSCT